MRIGFLQFRPRFGSPADNVETIAARLETTRDATIVLPELCTTGYVFRSRAEAAALAESAAGESLQRLRALARRNRLTLCCGFAERSGRRTFNSAATLLPSGAVHIYRKAHLFDREKQWFDVAPSRFAVVRGAAPFGVMICFDWFFPEACRALALAGARVILHPSNLVLPWCQTAMITRCLENRVYAVTCNRVGRESRGGVSLRFTGGSQIVDPAGRVLVRASTDDEELHIVSIDPRTAADKRVTPRTNLFADRRPALYGAIARRIGRRSQRPAAPR
jgi:predicted amidohydrolase